MLLQILAWNGGGKSNYTEIVKEGSYTKSVSHQEEDIISIPGVEIDISALNEYKEHMEGLAAMNGELLREKVADISQKVNDLVEEELTDLFGRD